MPRVLSLYLPTWPTDRLARRQRSQAPASAPPRGDTPHTTQHRAPHAPRALPILIITLSHQREIVAHASEAAARAGVTPGMDLAHARALLRGAPPLVAPHTPVRDDAALEALARWATRWSPIVSRDGSDGLALNIAGCEHLFGGEEPLARDLLRRVQALGFAARVGVAATLGAAWAVARFGRGPCVCIEPGGELAALAPLPVAALRIEPEAVTALREVGIERIGHVLDLPRSLLPARYGDDLVLRLDQALGRAFEHISPVIEPEPVRVHMELPGGTAQWESVAAACRSLIDRLALLLETRESGLRRLDARFTRLEAAPHTLTIQVARPTRRAAHLWGLLRPHLERLNLACGITEITLCAGGVAAIAHAQARFTPAGRGTASDDGTVDRAIDTIANRLGNDRVLRPGLHASHRPERACTLVSAIDSGSPSPQSPTHAIGPTHRPSRLYAAPRPVRVIALSPDGPVLSVILDEGERRVISSIGPERIGGEWWRAREPARDYFRVQDHEGRWLWVFREAALPGTPDVPPSSLWYIHGEWA